MERQVEVTVGHSGADFSGDSHLAIQAAVDYCAALGGGTVRVLAGTYHLGNAVHLRDRIRLAGCGEKTVLIKAPSHCTPLVDDVDWYEWQARVEDPSGFSVGGGCLLRADNPRGEGQNVTKHTVLAIEGNVLRLDSQPRKNLWTTHGATASTLHPLVTANWVKRIEIRDLVLDGNREHNDHLDGNYGGCVFLQDCEQVTIEGVVARNNEGDGISWQICHDVIVRNCASYGHRDLGLHPGSGSLRPVIRGNRIADCRIGLFWCWGVKQGLAEDNEIRRCSDYGISIGHRDTDNLMRGNRVYESGKVGLYFRPEDPAVRGPHRNVVEDNLVQNAGTAEQPGVGIELAGPVRETVLRRNRVVNTPGGHMAIGVRIGASAGPVTLADNTFVNVARAVEDERS